MSAELDLKGLQSESKMDQAHQFWAGVLLGFFFGVIGNILASQIWELRTRSRAYDDAKELVGKWKAFNIRGRTLEPMDGAGNTTISATSHW